MDFTNTDGFTFSDTDGFTFYGLDNDNDDLVQPITVTTVTVNAVEVTTVTIQG